MRTKDTHVVAITLVSSNGKIHTALATHARESQVSYVSFFGDVLKFFRKHMDENIFRGICRFDNIKKTSIRVYAPLLCGQRENKHTDGLSHLFTR